MTGPDYTVRALLWAVLGVCLSIRFTPEPPIAVFVCFIYCLFGAVENALKSRKSG